MRPSPRYDTPAAGMFPRDATWIIATAMQVPRPLCTAVSDALDRRSQATFKNWTPEVVRDFGGRSVPILTFGIEPTQPGGPLLVGLLFVLRLAFFLESEDRLFLRFLLGFVSSAFIRHGNDPYRLPYGGGTGRCPIDLGWSMVATRRVCQTLLPGSQRWGESVSLTMASRSRAPSVVAGDFGHTLAGEAWDGTVCRPAATTTVRSRIPSVLHAYAFIGRVSLR